MILGLWGIKEGFISEVAVEVAFKSSMTAYYEVPEIFGKG